MYKLLNKLTLVTVMKNGKREERRSCDLKDMTEMANEKYEVRIFERNARRNLNFIVYWDVLTSGNV